MEAKEIMDIIGEADCHSECCFIDSEGTYKPLGWARNLAEISFKAGQDSVFDSFPENLPPLLEIAHRTGRKEVVSDIVKLMDCRLAAETFAIKVCHYCEAKLKEWEVRNGS